MSDLNELNQYLNRYQGITRVFKQVQAALLMNVAQTQIVLEDVSSYAESNKVYRMMKYIENIAIDFKIQGLKYNKEIGNQQFDPFVQKADQLEKEIALYKNQQNKLSTGLSYIELGNLYLAAGDITEAFRSFERVHNYFDTGDIYSYHLNWSVCMLIERRYDQLKAISPKEALPLDRVKRQQHTTLFLFQALRCIYQGQILEFLQIIKESIQHDYIVEDPVLLLVSSLREIGILIVMVALTRCSRQQVQDLLSNDSIRFFVTLEDSFLQILESYISLNYNKLVQLARPLLLEYSGDSLFRKYTFSEVLMEKVVRQYMQPYKKISLQKVVGTLGLDIEVGLEYLKKQINANHINFLYDPIDQVFVQKATEKSKKYATYENAVATIGNYLHKKQHQMLRYQLSIVNQENMIRKNKEHDFTDSNFTKFSKSITGFFDKKA